MERPRDNVRVKVMISYDLMMSCHTVILLLIRRLGVRWNILQYRLRMSHPKACHSCLLHLKHHILYLYYCVRSSQCWRNNPNSDLKKTKLGSNTFQWELLLCIGYRTIKTSSLDGTVASRYMIYHDISPCFWLTHSENETRYANLP